MKMTQGKLNGPHRVQGSPWNIAREREWVAATDPTSGRRYFRNRLTREAKWDEPPSDDEAVDKWLERTFAVLSGGEVSEARRLVV